MRSVRRLASGRTVATGHALVRILRRGQLLGGRCGGGAQHPRYNTARSSSVLQTIGVAVSAAATARSIMRWSAPNSGTAIR